MQNAKAAVGNGGHRDIQVTAWRPLIKSTLRGFLSVDLPSGIVIHNITVHEKGEARWIGLPSREWTDQQGRKQFAKLIEFRDRPTANRFRDGVLAAFDKYLLEAE